jgi:hypothetical protein
MFGQSCSRCSPIRGRWARLSNSAIVPTSTSQLIRRRVPRHPLDFGRLIASPIPQALFLPASSFGRKIGRWRPPPP